jgi:hypothetical protein
VALLAIGFGLLNRESVQNNLVQRATRYLSEKLKTKVSVKHVRFAFFNDFRIEGIYIEDEQGDTLAHVGQLSLRTSELFQNYWSNQTPILKHLDLLDVDVNLKRTRTSDRWNFDFLEEAFAGPSAPDTSSVADATTSGPMDPLLDLKELRLKNIHVNTLDAWRGEDLCFAIDGLTLDASEFQLDKKRIQLESLLIHKADVLVREYDGGKPEDNTPDDTTLWGTPFNPEGFQIGIDKLQIQQSAFRYLVDGAIPKPGEFDEKNLVVQQIELSLNNTRVVNDTLFSTLQHLSARERCGLEIKQVQAEVKLSQVQAALFGMELRTANSYLTNHYEMRYRNFHDFKEYIDRVTMQADLHNSYVSSKDLGYFANLLNQYPITVKLAGRVEGTVRDLKATQLSVSALKTSFVGDAHVTGLPDVENAFFDVIAKDFRTSGSDLNKLIPQTKTDAVAWNELKTINYQGRYKGKIDYFTADGNLQTSLGNAVVNLTMDFKPKNPSYKGSLATTKFNIGKLIKQSTVGSVTMKGTLDGHGFDLNTLMAKVNATVSEIEIDGTTYADLTINGLVENKKFDGIFISQDEKLALNFNGKLDLSGKQPSYNFTSRFVRFNLQKMGLTNEPILGSGYAELNFSGDHIDNFFGTAKLKNITIENQGKVIFLKEVDVQSFQENGIKTLDLKSSVADATLKGRYNISELAPTVQYFLHHYLPQYIKKPTNNANQSFAFQAQLKNVDTIMHTLFPSVTGLSNSYIDAYINSAEQKLGLDVNVPQFGYNGLGIQQIAIVSAGDYNALDMNVTTAAILYNNETIIPSAQINTSMANDTASLAINTQSINELLGDASINCKATALNNQLYVHLLPSNLRLRNDNWQFYSGEDLIFGKEIIIRDFKIENGAQLLTLNTVDEGNQNLTIDIQEIDLESMSEYANATNPALSGRISGAIQVTDFKNNPVIRANLFSTQNIKVNQDTLGALNANLEYNFAKKSLQVNQPTTITRDGSTATVLGLYDGTDSVLNFTANLNKTNIQFLNQFLSDYVLNLNGLLTGQVKVIGDINQPDISGDLQLDQASWKVIFLGTTYTIPKANFHFNNQKIEMEKFTIQDEREGYYTGLVQGYIEHKNFSDFKLNLQVTSDNLLCLKTQEGDNELFFGTIPGKIDVDVKGELNDVVVDLNVRPLKGSVFNLPLNSKGDASTYDYVQFAEFGRDQDELAGKKKRSSSLKLNMNIDATEDALVNIILDANTREEIVARGSGNLHLGVDLGNGNTMAGTYTIKEGTYNFNFRGVLPRKFQIEDGGTVTWTGDPLSANLDLKAVYLVPKPLELLPLINQSQQQMDASELQEAKRKYKTYIPIFLTGPMNNPEIKFDIIQPDNKSVGNALDNLRKNQEALVSQAGVLLLLGEFKAPDGGIAASTYGKGAITTVSDVVSNYVSSEITNKFQDLTGIKGLNFNFNYQNKTDLLTAENSSINQVSATISWVLLKERLQVDFENSYDFVRGNTGNNGSYVGNFKAQFLVTQDGRLRLNTYLMKDPNIDGSANNGVTKSGLGLSFRQVFNRFADLAPTKRRKSKPLNTDTTTANLITFQVGNVDWLH